MTVLNRRLLLAGVMVATLAILSLAATLPRARASEDQSPIVAAALPYNGTYQGECWIFVKKIVLEATGRQMGYDYRAGFFEAGAIEVTAEEARPGDIIQLIDDDHTEPWVSYPGMHTAIVLENHGQGNFSVIDSNSNWDGVVRIRSNFMPAAAAARHGIDYHFYRIDPWAEAAQTEVVEIDEWWVDPVGPGDVLRVTSEDGCVSLRASVGSGSDVKACLPDGLVVRVTGQPVNGGGLTWVPVHAGPLHGWVAWSRLTPEPTGTPVEMSQLTKLFWVVPRVAFGR